MLHVLIIKRVMGEIWGLASEWLHSHYKDIKKVFGAELEEFYRALWLKIDAPKLLLNLQAS